LFFEKCFFLLFQLTDPDILGGPHPNEYLSFFVENVRKDIFNEILEQKNELLVKCNKTSEEFRNQEIIKSIFFKQFILFDICRCFKGLFHCLKLY
jgi:hypothetical protein